MLVCNYFFSLLFSDSFFMGLVVGLMGRFFGALGVLVGVVLFTSGWFCLHRGGFVYIGVVLFYIGGVFTSGWFYFRRGVKMVICGIVMMLFYNKLRS